MEGCVQCPTHDRPNELVCIACKTYLCPECTTIHKTKCLTPKYIHIYHYSEKFVIPQIEGMKEATAAKESSIDEEAKVLIDGLGDLVPKMIDMVNLLNQNLSLVNKSTSTLSTFSKQKDVEVQHSKIIEALEKEKIKAEKMVSESKKVEEKDKPRCLKEIIALASRIEAQVELNKNQETPASIFEKLNNSITPLMTLAKYQPLIRALGKMSSKCHYMRLSNYSNDWKLDRQFLSTKMLIADGDLTYGNTATNGYPGIIGTMPFDHGRYAFEVIPVHLCCGGKDGFGIIEREKYLSIWNADKVTPTIYEHMIGYFYHGEAKKMTVETI